MKDYLRILGGFALLLLIWQAAAMLLDKSIIVPSPLETFHAGVRLAASPRILPALWQTSWKVFVSLSLAILVGLPLGFVLGLYEGLYNTFRPIIMVIQAVPVISWLSLVIFVWGIGWQSPIFIAFFSLLPVSVLTTVSGVRNLDRDLLEMARLYRVPHLTVIRNIYLGSLLPFIAAILDVCIGQAWKVTLVAEYLSGGSGMGVEILMARMNIDAPAVWALTLAAVVLGITSERLLKLAARKIKVKWTYA